jgi:hypothetical protein
MHGIWRHTNVQRPRVAKLATACREAGGNGGVQDAGFHA